MKRTLLLTSGGIPKELGQTFLSHLPKSPEKIKVSFITTAAYGEEENPWWLETCRKELINCGMKNIEDLDLRKNDKKNLEKILADKDIIFVNGGNTFYLLYWVKKSGFDKLLPKLLDEGKMYIGVSAGSYIVCPTIKAATWKPADRNKIKLKDLAGLNLVPFLITAHFEEKYRSIVESAAKKTKYPIVALNDTQAVLVTGNKIKIVGEGKKEFYNGFKEV